MKVMLEIDPTEQMEIRAARGILEQLQTQTGTGAPTSGEDDVSLEEIVSAIADREKYGENRLGYLRRVAAAGDDGVETRELLEEHFGGNHRRYGGTHASIERFWRGSGGEAFAEQLISETRSGRHVMFGPARALILDAVGAELEG